MHHTDKYSEHSLVFVYELSGFGFESSCSHLKYNLLKKFAFKNLWKREKGRPLQEFFQFFWPDFLKSVFEVWNIE